MEQQPDGKTIKQIADELGVSKQAVQKRIKREPLATMLSGLSATSNGVLYIGVVGENLIKSAYLGDNRQPVADNQPTTDRQPVADTLSVVYSMIDTLKEQLSAKDKQIEDQQQTIRELTSALLAAQQTSQAAQALHAGTIQAQLGDGSKPGFFSRIFRAKKRI